MMSSEEVEVEDITQRHRREKKLLQNRIQALKKSSGKLDKKKKKELDEIISKLESELEQTHLNELSALQSNEPKIENNNQSIIPPVPRISKAQRRRDKKAADELAREKLIAEQELANINGPRNTELKTIRKILKEKGLSIYSVPSNGDCLYSAISHQLSTLSSLDLSVPELRKMAADFIISNEESFIPFICDPDTGDILNNEQFQQYCFKIANTNTWGSQIELQALSSSLKRAILVIQSTNPTTIFQGEEYVTKCEPLVLTYHRHMYGLGEHYNSTQKLLEDNENSDDS